MVRVHSTIVLAPCLRVIPYRVIDCVDLPELEAIEIGKDGFYWASLELKSILIDSE